MDDPGGSVFCPAYHTITMLSLKTVGEMGSVFCGADYARQNQLVSETSQVSVCRQIVPITSTREQIRRQLKGAAVISLSSSCHCHVHSGLGSLKRYFVVSIFL